VASALAYAGSSAAGIPASAQAARALGCASSDRTTLNNAGLFKNESRRVPK
jgi:hypothetical protein